MNQRIGGKSMASIVKSFAISVAEGYLALMELANKSKLTYGVIGII